MASELSLMAQITSITMLLWPLNASMSYFDLFDKRADCHPLTSAHARKNRYSWLWIMKSAQQIEANTNTEWSKLPELNRASLSPPAIPLQSDVALVAAAAAIRDITYSEASGVSTLFRSYVSLFGGLQRKRGGKTPKRHGRKQVIIRPLMTLPSIRLQSQEYRLVNLVKQDPGRARQNS